MWRWSNIFSLFNDLFIIELMILIENFEITKKKTWKFHQNHVILNWLKYFTDM